MRLSRITDPRFRDLLNTLSKEKLPLRVGFKLKGIIKTVNEEHAKYDELRLEAIKRYAKLKPDGELDLDENSGAIFESQEKMNGFVTDLNDLVAIELTNIGSISMSELGDNLSLTTEDLLILDGVITE
jgi:hypothetical protein